MKISKAWLNDYVECDDLSAEQFSELITTKVAEVDKVIEAAVSVSSGIVAIITDVRKHPERPGLQIAKVSTGNAEYEVVCGAKNCRPGIFTAFLPPGSLYYAQSQQSESKLQSVETRSVQGVSSQGILVSEAELGLSADHDGIMEFPQSTEKSYRPGTILAEIVGGSDTVIEIDNKSLTHRPDLWSHLGFAREISAILHRPLKHNPDIFADSSESGHRLLQELGSGKSEFSVFIDPKTKCRRFAALLFSGVSTVTSPLWMRRRLFSVDGGVRNLLVDLSNYVMRDIGQPNHAYDADLLQGKRIGVRMAYADEKFIGLDGIERNLTPLDAVICDESRAVALAGVVGGQETAVNTSTKRLLLESANFDPVEIRLVTKRNAIRTDASNRFEKSRSPYSVPLAIHRFHDLLTKLDSQVRVEGMVVDSFPLRPAQVSVPFSFNYIRDRLDDTISDETIQSILTSLGFQLSKQPEGKMLAQVPYERATRDISIADDLVEEVGRIYGYSEVREQAPLINSLPQQTSPIAELENKFRDRISGMGFSEVYNYSFMDPEVAQRFGFELSKSIRLLNPVDVSLSVVRTTLIPGMVSLLERNARFSDTAFLFELGRGYEKPLAVETGSNGCKPKGELVATERRLMSIGYMTGHVQTGTSRPQIEKGADFYGLSAVIKRLVRIVSEQESRLVTIAVPNIETALNSNVSSEAADFVSFKCWMHTRRAATIYVGTEAIGIIAELNPGSVDLAMPAAVAEIDLHKLLGLYSGVSTFTPLPKYPDSFFEMSIIMPKNAYYVELERLLKANVSPNLLRNIEVLEVYQGKPLEAFEKSISVKLSLGSADKTLSGEELSSIQDKLMLAVKNSNFTLRG